MTKHRVFISYHHGNDQFYKDELVYISNNFEIFVDYSVNTGDIGDFLEHETIRRTIRDEYLRDSTVTIVLVGQQTKNRKHVDWEIFSSMIDGPINKKSGIICLSLPTISQSLYSPHPDIVNKLPRDIYWRQLLEKKDYMESYPHIPARILESIYSKKSFIPILEYNFAIDNPYILKQIIEMVHANRANCEYDFSLPMRSNNS
jgi:hypothetical protein